MPGLKFKKQKKNILITGCGGYLGSRLLAYLAHSTETNSMFNIYATDKKNNLALQRKYNNFKNIYFYSIDLLDNNAVEEFFRVFKKINTVIHLAGNTKSRLSKLIQSNTEIMTENLLAAMSRYQVNNIIFASSASIYGTPLYLPIDTAHRAQPLTPYGVSKLNCERAIEYFSSKYSLNYIVFRIFNIYGESQYANDLSTIIDKPDYFIIPNIIHALNSNKTIPIYGNNYPTYDGSAVRDYIHIDDVIDAFKNAMQYMDSTSNIKLKLNLGTGKGTSVKTLIHMLSTILEKPAKMLIVKPNSPAAHSLIADTKTSRKHLGWTPKRALYWKVKR